MAATTTVREERVVQRHNVKLYVCDGLDCGRSREERITPSRPDPLPVGWYLVRKVTDPDPDAYVETEHYCSRACIANIADEHEATSAAPGE